MRHLRIILPVLLLFAGGCNPISEDMSHCPPDEGNVILNFRYMDGATDRFANHIGSVAVSVFDEGNQLVTTQNVSQTLLTTFQGTRLTLDPGTYRVVCWGNTGVNTCTELLPTPRITYANINSGEVTDGDRLFSTGQVAQTRSGNYPTDYTLTVPKYDMCEGMVDFTPAHRRIEIFVAGYDENGNTLPKVELTGLPAGADFFSMQCLAELCCSNHNTQPAGLAGKTYSVTSFNTFWFTQQNDVQINIKSPTTGQTIYTIPLNEAIAISGAELNIEIRLIIEFKQGSVEITIPTWNPNDIDPDYGWGY